MKYTYKGTEHISNSPITLHTQGKYCEDNVVIEANEIIDVSTSAEMDALLIMANMGKMYHYIGTTDVKYTNGNYYKVSGGTASMEQIGAYGFVLDSSFTYADVYKSNNQGKHNTQSIVKITIKGSDEFTIRINSYAESNYDYTLASKLDAYTYPTAYTSTYTQIHTRGFQYNPSKSTYEDNKWISYTYTGLNKEEHYIYVVYRKDSSASSGDDTGRFIMEYDELGFTEYIAPMNKIDITDTNVVDVKNYRQAQVVDSNLAPANIKLGVNILGVDGTYGGGGGSGYNVYITSGGNNYDYIQIKFNDDPAFYLSNNYDFKKRYVNIPASGITKFKVFGADHIGTYPSVSSSWARFRPHNGDTWTEIMLQDTEEQSVEFVLTGDIDLWIEEYTCLDQNTLITMANGDKKPIKYIRVGDMVRGYNHKTYIVYRDEYYSKAYSDYYDVWEFENNTIKTTNQHRFYNVEHQKFMYLQDWKIGEHALTEDGKQVALLSHTKVDEPCKYYSLWCNESGKKGFELKDWKDGNNYYANGLLAGNRYSEDIKYEDNNNR